jgi:hypothetical protein
MLKGLEPPRLAGSSSGIAAPPERRLYGVGGDVEMTTIALMIDAARLSDALGAIGPLAILPLSEAPPGLHPVCLDLWQVEQGRAEALGIDQHRWSQLAGAASGATAAGSLGAMMGAGVGGVSGASVGGMVGAWLGPAGLWWGASAGWLLGGTTGGVAAGMMASMTGAALGAATGGGLSHETSRFAGSYKEVSILVPGVRAPGRDGPGLLVERMYTDSPLGKWLNELLGFGFNKHLASVDRPCPASYRVGSPDGRTLVAWTMDPSAQPRWRAARAHPELAVLRRWLDQPLLGHLGPGRLIVSWMDRLFDDPSALAAPVEGRLEVGPGFAACLPAGDYAVGRGQLARAFAATHVPVRLTYPRPLEG